MTAMAIANAALWPSDAGSIAIAATPAGTLPARKISRSDRVSAPWRL